MSIRSFYLFICLATFPLFSFASPADESRVDVSSLTTVDGSHPANLVPHPTTPNMYIQRSLDPMTGRLTEVFYTVAETENGRQLIPIDIATARDLNAALKQDGNFRRNFTGAVRGFPAEYGKFNAAMIVMELVGCYGIGNGSLFNEWTWAPTTNSNTPLCAEHLLKAMTTLEGNIGFFSFVLGNRIASSNINNAVIFASELRGKPITEKVMRKWRPLIGYAGMSFGMAAQQVVSHLLTIPTFKECFRDLAKIDFSSTFCKSALNHFLSAEKFWLDFGAGIPSLIGGAMMSAGSQKFFQWLLNNGKFFNAPAQARASQSALLRYMNQTRTLRVAKTALRVVRVGAGSSGVGGVFIMVGELVIFLAWTKVLEIPTMQMVWYLYDAPDVRRNTQQLLATASAIERAQGLSPESVDVSCTMQRTRGGSIQRCKSVDYLAQSLKDLDFFSRRYRERVTLARLTRSFPDYMMKWEKYVSSFFSAKFLLQEIYTQRSEKPPTLLSLYDTAFAVKTTWEEYFRASTAPLVQSHQIFLQKDMAQLEAAFTAYKDSFKDASVSNRSTLETQLATLLVGFKQKITAQQPWNSERICGGFDRDPSFCRAMKILRFIPASKDLFFSQNRNSFVSYNVEWTHLLTDTLPIENTLRQVLCSNDFIFKSNAKMDGLPATLELPRLVALSNDAFYSESCNFARINPLFLAKDMDESAEFSDIKPGAVWLTNFSKYIDPLSVLTDTRMRLTTGATADDARRWWNSLMTFEVMSFYKKFVASYKQMVDDNLISFVSYESPSLLVANNSVYRGPRSAATPTNESNVHHKVLNRESVNMSLIGQMQIYTKALEKVTGGFYPGPNQRRVALKQKLDHFLLLFAEHTRHIRHANDAASINDIPLENITSPNPFLFTQDVSRTLFGNSFEEKTQRMGQLMDLSGELSADLVGLNFDDIDNIATEITFTAQQVSQMTPAEYKKYTVLQIVKHIRLLLEETNNYYDSYIFLAGLFNLTKE